MDNIKVGKNKCQYVDKEIVPVHMSSCSNSKSVDEQSSKINNHKIMKVKDDGKSEQSLEDRIESIDMSDWLHGGPIGGRATVLVFRSCLLAPREKSLSETKISPPSGSSSGVASRKCSLSSIKELNDASVRTLISVNEKTTNSWKHQTVDDSDSGFDNDKSFETDHSSFFGEHVVKTKRDIRDVLNDINKISLKRKHDNMKDVSNQVPSTSPRVHNEDNADGYSGNETVSTKSSHSSLQAKHDNNMGHNAVSSASTSTPKVVSEPKSLNSSLSFNSTFSDIYNKDFKDIKFLPKNDMPASILKLAYKTCTTETKLLSRLLHAHGFIECPSHSRDYTLLWTGLHAKPDLLRSLAPHQRVNHFPRSYELTRKDKLFKNIEKMQHMRATKSFDFIPLTFLMPVEYHELCSAHYRTKGPWIIKPAASSRGRGIYIVNSPDKIPKAESVVVAKYIDKPLLVDGHKCDLRLYVCVTSFDPLLIYLYEEGLVRFATVKYDKNNKTLWNPCMHLCNYSINKYHCDYIKCEDPSVENVGHKWTLSAFLRHLKREGRDTAALMASIEDVVIKSILSCTHSIASATQKFVPYINNCFELYGFDILIDENLKPWLLEINLSPSLGCDSPLDARLKSSLLADTLTLVGIPAYSKVLKTPIEKKVAPLPKSTNLRMRIVGNHRVHSLDMASTSIKKGFTNTINSQPSGITFLSNAELRLIKMVNKQYERRGGYVRIFPSQDSWQKYAQYLDPITGIPMCNTPLPNGAEPQSIVSHNYNLLVHSQVLPDFDQTLVNTSSHLPQRLSRYERVLPVCPRVSIEPSSSPGPSTQSTSTSAAQQEQQAAKARLMHQLDTGKHLTVNESRKAFGMFLNCILKRISNTKSEQAAYHAELVHRFLKKVAFSMSFVPYNLKGTSQKISDKDKSAMIAKELNDFLYLYHRETETCVNMYDKSNCVTGTDFAHFIYGASESDLEDILLLIIKMEGNVVPFLGDRLSPLCIDMPYSRVPSVSRGPGSPSRTPLLLRYLTHITPLHSRRYTIPTPETPTISDDSTLDQSL